MEIPPPVGSASDEISVFVIVSLVLGLIGLCGLAIPGCGCPLNILGMIFGIIGLRSHQKPFAIVGIVINGMGLLFSFCYFSVAIGFSIANSISG